MADIQSAAQWLGTLLVEEARYLYKVEDKVKELRDELDWMQCFLRDADAVQYDNAMARRWVAQIREFAYEAEDTIEKFLVRVVPTRGGRIDVMRIVQKIFGYMWEARLIHQIGNDIDTLKYKISLLTSRLHTYGIKLKLEETSSSWELRKRTTFTSYVEKKIFGINRYKFFNTLVDDLVSGIGTEKKSNVFSICGDGGVGKTFMAKKIFHDKKIRAHFEAFAWAYVSQPCQSSSLQQTILSSLTSKSREHIAQMSDSELKEEVYKFQCKYKCLIVLDGIWEKEFWDSIKDAFPIPDHHFNSKVLITNRSDEVARHVHPNVDIHFLKKMNDHDSNNLLEETISFPADIHDRKDRGIAIELKKDMLRCCDGLPLAISLLGGVLATKKTLEEWKKVHKFVSSRMILDEENGPKWKRILELSYYDIPFQLKPSFLYLGYFPTNLEISTKKIIRLWEAEGLVSLGDDEIAENTLEDVAEHYLSELVERSLVQVGSRGLTGKAKTCLVHDHMRELCWSKASKGNWLSIVQLGIEEVQQPLKSSSKYPKSSRPAKKRFRRLAIYYSRTANKLPSDYQHARYIRSLLFFNTLVSDAVLIPLRRAVLKKAFNDYKLLRVLDIEDINMHSLPEEVGNLIHLRYLSLRGSRISLLPSTIKNLRCLQTLDIRVHSFVCLKLPNVLWMMDRLVHLYLPLKTFSIHKVEELKLEGLKSLETLSNFSNNCKAEDVETLSNLRRFTSCDFHSRKKSIIPLLGSPNPKLAHLEHVSLSLDSVIFDGNPQMLASCSKLYKLWVKGEIKQPLTPVMLPKNLIQLSLHNSKLQSDPMQVLEQLPSLKKLSLKDASYMGVSMKCSEKQFLELEYLTLKGLEFLEDWTIEETSMSKLSRLEINGCQKLKTVPDGLSFIKSLRELEISFMPYSFFERKSPKNKEEWVHYPKVQHVPWIKISHILELEDMKPH